MLLLSFFLEIYCNIHHHHHHIVLAARISLTLFRHSSLSFIALGRSSGQQPVSSHSCWMYVRAGRPAFARPCVGIHIYCNIHFQYSSKIWFQKFSINFLIIVDFFIYFILFHRNQFPSFSFFSFVYIFFNFSCFHLPITTSFYFLSFSFFLLDFLVSFSYFIVHFFFLTHCLSLTLFLCLPLIFLSFLRAYFLTKFLSCSYFKTFFLEYLQLILNTII